MKNAIFYKTFPVGKLGCNCTILGDHKTKEAIVIDAGDDFETIQKILQAEGFAVKYAIHTHAHIDHIGATFDVQKNHNCQVCLHKEDLPLYQNINQQAMFLGLPTDYKITEVTSYLQNKDDVCVNDIQLQALHTPGHTPGSMCFYSPKLKLGEQEIPVLFSGDTLFYSSIGRTDLWGGDHDQILASIKEDLLTLPEETLVICGHGKPTTIGFEKQNNPFLK